MASSYFNYDPLNVPTPKSLGMPDWLFNVQPTTLEDVQAKLAQVQELQNKAEAGTEALQDSNRARQNQEVYRQKLGEIIASLPSDENLDYQDIAPALEKAAAGQGDIGTLFKLQDLSQSSEVKETARNKQSAEAIKALALISPEAAKRKWESDPILSKLGPAPDLSNYGNKLKAYGSESGVLSVNPLTGEQDILIKPQEKRAKGTAKNKTYYDPDTGDKHVVDESDRSQLEEAVNRGWAPAPKDAFDAMIDAQMRKSLAGKVAPTPAPPSGPGFFDNIFGSSPPAATTPSPSSQIIRMVPKRR